ncbi:exostosin-2-like [Styela clava]
MYRVKNDSRSVRGVRAVYVAAIFTLLLFIVILLWISFPLRPHSEELERRRKLKLDMAANLPEKVVTKFNALPSETGDLNCRMYSCFNVYKCDGQAKNQNKISVYLYPLAKYVTETGDELTPSISKEFYELYTAIADSEYFTDDPNNACLFIPPVDLLNQNNLNVKDVAQVLSSLPYWNEGANHILFNMVPGSYPEFNTVLDVPHEKAIIAGGGFSHWTYRPEYDISIPVFSSVVNSIDLAEKPLNLFRSWLLISSQTNIHSETRSFLGKIESQEHDVLLLEKCRNVPEDVSLQLRRCNSNQMKHEKYPEILQDGVFCLILRSARLGQSTLSDVLKAGCIPVFATDGYIKPFSEVVDWTRASVTVRYEDLPNVVNILRKISPTEVKLKQKRVKWIWDNYFSSMSAIALTTLRVINDRIFTHKALKYEDWNEPVGSKSIKSPLFLPLISPKEDGFTAIVLAYDRIDSLYQVVSAIDKVPSLKKVIVVWNNQKKPPPPKEEWPVITRPVKVIRTTSNKLSNRFYPFADIETEAILAIDDDIVMLTADEIEYGYQVWREFPDRLVGFPPRLHLWDENGHLKYESEWTNDVSIVLTGAAFYHKYFNHLFWNKMPDGIRDFVDDHMNCEDIAMNFLISNYTGKAPIKVTPRKKFKCSECLTGGSLSLEQSHMVERSTCMNHFMEVYGTLPLKTVNFRADPVLYMDEFPDRLKAFPDMGSL